VISLLSEAVTRYIAYRRSLGCGMVNEAQILQMFCHVMGPETLVKEIAPDRVLSFLDGTGPVTLYWHRKHQALEGFYRFALARNYVSTSPLPAECPPRPLSKAPYIFTREELLHLLASTDSFPNRKNTLSRYGLRVLLLLLYGAGLRISEALALTVADTDLAAGVLTIRDTKFHKTRLVPIGPDLKGVLVSYSKQRNLPADHTESQLEPFFLNRQGGAPTYSQVEKAFRRLRVHAGIRRSDGLSHPPRMHDLRHAFAVHRLVSWYRQGADVQKLLPQLSTYLGHVDIASTQWYLTMTPELLSQASLRFEHYALEVAGNA
jgi:integrase/recombinase XerD